MEKKSSRTAASCWQTKAKAKEKIGKKRGTGQSVCWKAWWRPSNMKCAVSKEYASCWVHQDCRVADEQKTAFRKATGVSEGKDECRVRLKRRERDYWMGTEMGMLVYLFKLQILLETVV